MALNEFEGTVMLVSHDRALLREVCDEFWLVSEGAVKPFDGDLDDYQKWLLEQSREAAREQSRGDKAKRKGTSASKSATPARDPAPSSLDVKALRKEFASVDERLAALTADRNACEIDLAAPRLKPDARAELGRRLKQLSEEVEALEARWLDLSTRLDGASIT